MSIRIFEILHRMLFFGEVLLKRKGKNYGSITNAVCDTAFLERPAKNGVSFNKTFDNVKGEPCIKSTRDMQALIDQQVELYNMFEKKYKPDRKV